jgi:hypothetical protein
MVFSKVSGHHLEPDTNDNSQSAQSHQKPSRGFAALRSALQKHRGFQPPQWHL